MVQQDLFKCEQLWERAAEQGDDMAKENLVTLREHMKLMQNDAKKGVLLRISHVGALRSVESVYIERPKWGEIGRPLSGSVVSWTPGMFAPCEFLPLRDSGFPSSIFMSHCWDVLACRAPILSVGGQPSGWTTTWGFRVGAQKLRRRHPKHPTEIHVGVPLSH